MSFGVSHSISEMSVNSLQNIPGITPLNKKSMSQPLWRVWPCHRRTPRQPLNNSIRFCFYLESLSDNYGQMKVEREQKHEHSDFQYIFFPCLGAKNYSIMSFSWCAHQQEWKPHLSSFGVIENRSLGNSVGLSAFFAVKKCSWRKATRRWGTNESRWAMTPTLTIVVRPQHAFPFVGNPIQFAAAVNQDHLQAGYKYATYICKYNNENWYL